MNSIHDIEKQIAQNANNKTFEYKEAYWDSALATLQAAEKAKRRKGFFWIFLSIIFIGVIGVYFAKNLYNNSNEISNYIPRGKNSKTHIEILNINPTSNSSITTNNKLGTNDYNEPNSSTTESKINNNISNLNKTVTNTEKNITNSGNNKGIVTNKNITTPITNKQPNKNTQHLLNKPNKNNGLANYRDMIANNNQTNSNVNSQFTDNVINNNTAIKTSYKREKSVLEELISIELDSLTETIISSDTNSERVIKMAPSISQKQNKLSFVINLGALASKSFTEKQINLDAPYLGGELYYQISNKFNASIGGGWYTRSKIGYLTSYSSTVYVFGKSETTTTVSFDKIYFVEIPLKINYALTKNHLVGVGATYSFILGGENRVLSSQTESGAYGTLSTQSEQEQSIPGFEGAYTNNSKAIFLSYEYRFKRLGAEARYHYGLNDITNDNIFMKTQVDRNSRFLITLKYLLFK